jgi:hypothetical protein
MFGVLHAALLACAPARAAFGLPQAQVIAVSNGPNDPNFQIPLPQAVVLPGPAPPQPDWRPPVDVPDPHARDVEFSVTLSLSAGHVPPGWLDAFLLWMQAMCKAGLGALAKGDEGAASAHSGHHSHARERPCGSEIV